MDKETRMIHKLAWAIIHAGDVDYKEAPAWSDAISFFPQYIYRLPPVDVHVSTENKEEEIQEYISHKSEKEIFAHFCKIIAETLTQFNEE